MSDGSGSHIDAATVRRIANLARLSLTDEEREFYQSHLEKILTYVDLLDSAPVGDLAESDDGESTMEREDVSRESLPAIVAVSQAKMATGTSFRVPRVVE